MTAKEYLEQAQYLDEIIDNYYRDMEYWKSLSVRVSGIHFEEYISKPNYPTNAAFVQILEKIDEIQQKITEETAKGVALRDDIKTKINMISDFRERLVLQYKYLDKCTNKEIAKLIGKSVSTVHRIHRKALKNFSALD